MKKYRDHYFKASLAAYIISLTIIISCGQSSPLEFCEGVTPAGKGVNCGKKFSTGDITALIKLKNKPSSEKINVKVFEITASKKKFLFDNTIKVSRDGDYIIHNIRFLNPGKFEVIAMDNKEEISKGIVEIIE